MPEPDPKASVALLSEVQEALAKARVKMRADTEQMLAEHGLTPAQVAAFMAELDEAGEALRQATAQAEASESVAYEKGDIVLAADGNVYQRNVRYIDPTFVWRDFTGDWRRDEAVPRPLVRLVADPQAGASSVDRTLAEDVAAGLHDQPHP